MELGETFEWRGLGSIERSGLRLRPEFADWDAEALFELPGVRIADPKACQCGEVLVGAIKPWECGVFGTACTPERPLGTCMVSSRGSLRRVLQLRPAGAEGVKLRDEVVTLAHGAGGKATRALVEGLFLEELLNPLLEPGSATRLCSSSRAPASPSRPTRTWSSRSSSRAGRSGTSR